MPNLDSIGRWLLIQNDNDWRRRFDDRIQQEALAVSAHPVLARTMSIRRAGREHDAPMRPQDRHEHASYRDERGELSRSDSIPFSTSPWAHDEIQTCAAFLSRPASRTRTPPRSHSMIDSFSIWRSNSLTV